MRLFAILLALLAAGPAFAVPFIPPRAAETAVVKAFMEATQRRDLDAYEKLLAPDGRFIKAGGVSLDRRQWLAEVETEFAGNRETRFLNVHAGFSPHRRQELSRRFMLVMVFTDCRPRVYECFPQWRTQIIEVSHGRIIEVQTSGDFHLRLTEAGDWTLWE